MLVRKARIADLEAVSILFNSYRVFYKKKEDIPGAEIFIGERLRNRDSEIFIVENDDSAVIGFVQLYPIFSSTRMKRLWLLNDLFVEPEYRSKGASVLLIDECKKLCSRTYSCGMILETAKDNAIGNNLYLKTGFLPDCDHNYYEWEINSTHI